LAGEGNEHLVAAIGTLDSGETEVQVAAAAVKSRSKIKSSNLPRWRTPNAIGVNVNLLRLDKLLLQTVPRNCGR
jgi:hypothetical protein